jgi:ferritin
MNDRMYKALNDQVNEELFASYLYFSMASWFDAGNLGGFATWLKAQAAEELKHAMKLYGYITDRGHQTLLAGIKAPQTTWETPLAAFENALAHEKHVTQRYNELTDLAIELKDHASREFLGWFLTEQVEEEKTTGDVVQQLKLANNHPGALMMLNHGLGARG